MSQNREETEKSNIDPPPIMTEKLSSNDNTKPSNIDIMETDSKENNESNKNNNNNNSDNIPFDENLTMIYKHIENNTMTKEIFDTFWNKIQRQFTNYQNRIEQLEKIANKNGKKIKAASPVLPEIDVAKLIEDNINSQVVAFENIESKSPKTKGLFIEFYPQFLTFIPQKKCDQNANKTVIYYDQIEKIVSVPEKCGDILLYCQLKHDIKLRYRKGKIQSFSLLFEDLSDPKYNEEMEEIDICNMNTTLPAKLKGHEEDLFCRVIKELCKQEIFRHNKQIFKTVDQQNKQNSILYFIDCHYKANKICVYPLRAGLFLQPKPMKFYPSSRIQYYEYTRHEQGLRYFDMDIVLYPEDEDETDNASNSNSKEEMDTDDEQKKAKKKRDKTLTIELSMISINDMAAIEMYFAALHIPQKENSESPSPDRRNNTKSRINGEDNDSTVDSDDNHNHNHNGGPMDCDLSESDDEEFNPDSDDGDYGDDSEDGDDGDDDEDDSASDATANPEDFTDDDDVSDLEESEDIDMNELKDVIKNVELAQKGEKIGAGSYPLSNNDNKNKNKNKNTTKSEKSQGRKNKKVVKRNVSNNNKNSKKKSPKKKLRSKPSLLRKNKKPVKKELNKKNGKSPKSPKKQTQRKSKKRSRDDMESNSWTPKSNKDNPIEIKDDSDDDATKDRKVRRIVNMFHPSKRMRIGRKSTDYGKKSGKIVSKSIVKKSASNSSPKIKDDSIEIVGFKPSPNSTKKRKKKSLQNSPSPIRKKNNNNKSAKSTGSDKENKPKKVGSKTKAKKKKNTNDNKEIVSLIDDDDNKQRKLTDMFKTA